MVNNPATQGLSPADLPVLPRLLLAYAPAQSRPWQLLCWLLDQRLAAIARRGGDPTIAAIRLAWWDAVLVEGDLSKGSGEPLVERWREIAPPNAGKAAEQLIEGWRYIVTQEAMSDEDLHDYGQTRGGGLFALLAPAEGATQTQAIAHTGALWALWDLAAHVRDEALASRALAVAKQRLAQSVLTPSGRTARPLRLARAIMLPDIKRGRAPAAGFSPTHYARLLIASLRG